MGVPLKEIIFYQGFCFGGTWVEFAFERVFFFFFGGVLNSLGFVFREESVFYFIFNIAEV